MFYEILNMDWPLAVVLISIVLAFVIVYIARNALR